MRRHDYPSKTVIEFGADKGLSFTKDELQEVREDLAHEHPNGRLAKAETQANIEVEIETSHHTLTGVVEEWGLNHPNFLFDDGRRAFITYGDDPNNVRLLFKGSYHGGGSTPKFKYRVNSFEASIHWHQTPDCPVCGDALTYGSVQWDVHDPDGYMAGWLCEDAIPARVEEGRC
jgi:hypothetical protein